MKYISGRELLLSILLFFMGQCPLQGANIRTEPWLTEPAIEFLSRFFEKHPDAYVLEFGSGASTIWMAKRTKNLWSVDHSEQWHQFVCDQLNKNGTENVKCYLKDRPYYNFSKEFPNGFFDLILVDGRNRKGCIAHSISKLKSGGILMLDNAERARYQAVFPLLEGWKHVSTEQLGKDKYGYSYRGWKTDWWFKP